MLLLKRKTFEIAADGPLVTADEAETVASAEAIVAAATAEAEAIRESAKVAYEAERQRGYEAGIAQGRAEILEQKISLVSESVAFMEGIEGRITDLVVKTLRKCLGEMDVTDLVRRIVTKSLEAIVRNQRQVTIRVAPEMVAPVKERLQSILADFPSVAFAEVAEDAKLSGAACIVETEAGVVAASVEGQLAAIEKSFRKYFSPIG